jgi:hypothetical protein
MDSAGRLDLSGTKKIYEVFIFFLQKFPLCSKLGSKWLMEINRFPRRGKCASVEDRLETKMFPDWDFD